MLGKQPVHNDSELRVKKRRGKMSLEEKTTAIPNMQSTPLGDKEKSDKRNCILHVGKLPEVTSS